MKSKAKGILPKNMSQKKLVSLWRHFQTQSSSSSEEEGEGRYWDHKRWEDLSEKFDLAWRLAKERKDTWNKSLKESHKREEELMMLVDAIKDDHGEKSRTKRRGLEVLRGLGTLH